MSGCCGGKRVAQRRAARPRAAPAPPARDRATALVTALARRGAAHAADPTELRLIDDPKERPHGTQAHRAQVGRRRARAGKGPGARPDQAQRDLGRTARISRRHRGERGSGPDDCVDLREAEVGTRPGVAVLPARLRPRGPDRPRQRDRVSGPVRDRARARHRLRLLGLLPRGLALLLALPDPLPHRGADEGRHRRVRQLLRLDPALRDRLDPALAPRAVLLRGVPRQAVDRRPARAARAGGRDPAEVPAAEPGRPGGAVSSGRRAGRPDRGDRPSRATGDHRGVARDRVRLAGDAARRPARRVSVPARARAAAAAHAEGAVHRGRPRGARRPHQGREPRARGHRPGPLGRPVPPLRRHLGA